MNIKWTPGRKSKNDRVFWFKSEGIEGWEPFTIYKLAILINQLGINEVKIIDAAEKQNGYRWPFRYKDALADVLNQCEKRIDWCDGNYAIIEKWAKYHKLPNAKEEIEPILAKEQKNIRSWTE